MSSIIGSISFISKDELYQREKPYSLKFTPPAGLPKSNVRGHTHDQILEDIRSREDQFNIEKNGFALVSLPEALTYEDFDDESKVQHVYLPQIAQLLQDMLGASRVQIFEHLVRVI